MRKLRKLIENARYPGRIANRFKARLHQNKYPDYVPYFPVVCDIEPNVKCNLACKMCQITTWDRDAPNMSLENFESLLKKIPTLMKIKLQGMGEPFLNKELLLMVKAAVDRKIIIVTNTNGTMFNEDICTRVVNSGLDTISFSIDGATAETYEKIRIKSNFRKVTENLKRLVSVRGNASRPRINVWMVGMAENIHELPDMVRMCREIGVDEFALQHDVNYWGKEEWEKKLSDGSLAEHGATADKIIDESTALAKDLQLNFKVFKEDRYNFQKGKHCRWPWETFYVTADGFICPCCITCDPGVVNFGNVYERDLDDIWNGAEYRDFRRAIKNGDIPSFCKGCYEDF